MYDSITPTDIPADAQMVAGYVDGLYKWPQSGWDRFPDAVKVEIAVSESTDRGHVGDVESGDMTPFGAVSWVRLRRQAGADPTVYVNLSNLYDTAKAFDDSGEWQPHYWIAHYDGLAVVPLGFVAKQYANPALTGQHYDLSAVADYWPGVDPAPPPPAPQPPPNSIQERPKTMLVAFYAGFQHLFYVDVVGTLQHLYQPPGGFTSPSPSWALETVTGATGLPAGALVGGDQFFDQQHLYVQRADNKVLHAWQSLHGVPDFKWSTEVLPTP